MSTRLYIFSSILVLMSGCGAADGERNTLLGHVQQAVLTDPGLVPVPCFLPTDGTRQILWAGSQSDLLVADALAECGHNPPESGGREDNLLYQYDDYLDGVITLMQQVTTAMTGAPSTMVLGDWITLRSKVTQYSNGQLGSCSVAGDASRPAPYPLTPTPVPRLLDSANYQAWRDGMMPSLNLCIAQKLRNMSPGGSAGPSLLLSASEQIKLLSVIRERAQLSMLQYLQLFAINNTWGPSPESVTQLPNGDEAVTAMWEQVYFDMAGTGELNKMGADLLSAVQLTIMAGEEQTQLIVRNRAARAENDYWAKVGTTHSNPIEADWGTYSWSQELSQLLYFGNTLEPYDAAREAPYWQLPYEWTTRNFVDVNDPHVFELLRLAKRYDLVFTGSDPSLTYNAVQQKLQSERGTTTDVLLNEYGITAAHGTRLGQYLAAEWQYLGVTPLMAQHDYVGAINALNSDGTVTQVSGDFEARNATPAEIAPDFTSAILTPQYNPLVSRRGQGFSGSSEAGLVAYPESPGWSRMRRMGVIPALVAARYMSDSLIDAAIASPGSTLEKVANSALISNGVRILNAPISAAVGKETYVARPRIVECSTTEVCATGTDLALTREISLTAESSDPVLGQPGTGDTSSVYVVLVPSADYVQTLFAEPERSSWNGITARTLLHDAIVAGSFNQNAARLYYHPESGRWVGILTAQDDTVGYQKLVAFRSADPVADLNAAVSLKNRVKLLFPNLTAAHNSWLTNGTIAIGTGGKFGQIVRTQFIQNILDPAHSEADPFNIPGDWTPPFAADLFGGSPGASSVPHYLEMAKQSAQAAADRVNTAMSGLLQEQQDMAQANLTQEQKRVALGAAALKAQQGLEEARGKLCGLNNTNCDIAMSMRSLDRSWYSAMDTVEGCVGLYSTMYDVYTNPDAEFQSAIDSTGQRATLDRVFGSSGSAPQDMMRADEHDALTAVTKVVGFMVSNGSNSSHADLEATLGKDSMKCSAYHCMNDFLAVQTNISGLVVPALSGNTAPAFEGFAGGTLQSALIEQWSAIKSPDEMFNNMLKSLDAMGSRIDAASAQIEHAEAAIRRECSLFAMLLAFEAGWSTGFLSVTWSPGPLIAQEQRCQEAQANAGPEIASAIADRKGAMSSFTSSLQGFLGAQTRIQQSAAALEAAVADATIADTRVRTERTIQDMLASAQYQNVFATSFGLYRRYRDYDLWQASAQLEVARRQAAIARRAIESQYVVDLSRMTADETFVASPRTWADEIYEYDLSLPAAVGLTVSSSSAGSDAIVSNKVVDYVSNLQSFINGYSTTRPSAIAQDDIDVVTLPGLAQGARTSVTSGTKEYGLYPEQGTWLAHCAASNTWIGFDAGVIPDNDFCDDGDGTRSRPDRLRLAFELDPYGQPPASSGTVQYQYRYNARWTKLAINLVGTAVIDCQSATDPLVCYSKGYIPYTLAHVGSPPVTDFGGMWHNIALPQGRIEGGKAVALERWLEPLQDGWNTPYISAVARTEFSHRPLGGQYVLEFALTPELRPERIERVQIMMGSEYWVAQK